MLQKIEDFIFNRLAGKLLARAAVTLAGFLASGSIGAKIDIDPAQLAALFIAGAHAAFEWVKACRVKKEDIAAPGSPPQK